MVVMTETLQAVAAPADLIDEMLRIGQECVVTFPNFGHWRCRLQLATQGRMPVARHLPTNGTTRRTSIYAPSGISSGW